MFYKNTVLTMDIMESHKQNEIWSSEDKVKHGLKKAITAEMKKM